MFCGLALLLTTASAGKTEGMDFYQRGQFEKALDELKWEAMNGDRESQLLVGTMYLRGQGTEKDASQAAYWFQEAAKQGDATAQTNLAELYLSGQGLPQDDGAALFQVQQAAAQGYAPAELILGRMYLDGRGIERDPQTALVWFKRAAEQKNPESQYQLAQLLERGEGTAKDNAQALYWYMAAATLGYKAASEALQRLNKTPPPPPPTETERTSPTTQKKRVALLIANQDYRDKDLDLTGPINDAKLIEASLLKAGFKVTVKTNLNLVQMNRELSGFLADVDSNTVSLVYYSGHGVEIGGANYLIPTDFEMSSTLSGAQAAAQSVDIAAFYSRMNAEAQGSLNITILDACRNNPFKTRGLKGLSDGTGGLKAVSLPGGDGDGTIETFTAYAASSGQVAQDGVQNGPYATALAQQIGVPGQMLEVAFRNVRQEVAKRTANTQIPTSYANISSEFIFTPAK